MRSGSSEDWFCLGLVLVRSGSIGVGVPDGVPDGGLGDGGPDGFQTLTHDREPGSIALACLPAVLVLGDAAVGGEGILLLHLRDIQRPERRQEEAVPWRRGRGRGRKRRRGRGSRLTQQWYSCCVLTEGKPSPFRWTFPFYL